MRIALSLMPKHERRSAANAERLQITLQGLEEKIAAE